MFDFRLAWQTFLRSFGGLHKHPAQRVHLFTHHGVCMCVYVLLCVFFRTVYRITFNRWSTHLHHLHWLFMVLQVHSCSYHLSIRSATTCHHLSFCYQTYKARPNLVKPTEHFKYRFPIKYGKGKRSPTTTCLPLRNWCWQALSARKTDAKDILGESSAELVARHRGSKYMCRL